MNERISESKWVWISQQVAREATEKKIPDAKTISIIFMRLNHLIKSFSVAIHFFDSISRSLHFVVYAEWQGEYSIGFWNQKTSERARWEKEERLWADEKKKHIEVGALAEVCWGNESPIYYSILRLELLLCFFFSLACVVGSSLFSFMVTR